MRWPRCAACAQKKGQPYRHATYSSTWYLACLITKALLRLMSNPERMTRRGKAITHGSVMPAKAP